MVRKKPPDYGERERQNQAVWEEIYGRLTGDPQDGAAWAVLVERVAAHAKRDLQDLGQAAVDDVTQDTCWAVYRRLKAGQGPMRSFKGFVLGLYKGQRKRALRWHKRQRSTERLDDEPEEAESGRAAERLEAPAPSPEEAFLVQEMLEVLRQCVGELPARDGWALLLYYAHGASFVDVARDISTPQHRVTEVNARQIVSRARRRVAACVERQSGGG